MLRFPTHSYFHHTPVSATLLFPPYFSLHVPLCPPYSYFHHYPISICSHILLIPPYACFHPALISTLILFLQCPFPPHSYFNHNSVSTSPCVHHAPLCPNDCIMLLCCIHISSCRGILHIQNHIIAYSGAYSEYHTRNLTTTFGAMSKSSHGKCKQ